MTASLTTLTIRPWQDGDAKLLEAIGGGLSEQSIYNRFLTGYPALPSSYLNHIARAPRNRWDAAVALLDDAVVGWAEAARYENTPREAELAVVVVDALHRRGVGSALVGQLLRQCLAAGIVALHAEVLADNRAVRGLIRRLFGAHVCAVREGYVLHYRLPLPATTQLRAAGPLADSA